VKPPAAYLHCFCYRKVVVPAVPRLWVRSALPAVLRQDVAWAGEAPCPRHTLPRGRAASALLKPVFTGEPGRGLSPAIACRSAGVLPTGAPPPGSQGVRLHPCARSRAAGTRCPSTGLWVMEISVLANAPGGILLSASYVISLSDQSIRK